MQVSPKNTVRLQRLKHYAPPALTMGIPVAYIVAEHISWKRKKPDSLRRMIIQQTSFWIAAIAGGILMHDTHFQKKPMSWKLPRFTLASALLIAGFAGGERLAKLLYPKKPSLPKIDNGINAFLAQTRALQTTPIQPERFSPVGAVPVLKAANGPLKAYNAQTSAV